MYKIECPYCEETIEIDDFEDEFEQGCPHCEEEFKVEVEYEPVFSTSKFNYVECEECESKFDKDYSVRVPAPKGYEPKSSLCFECFCHLQIKD